MENKLPEKYENNFFSRVKKFFSSIFNKKTAKVEKEVIVKSKPEDKPEIKVETNYKENEFDKMKEASNKVKLKDDILEIVEKKPQLIETLPIERLEELDKMYDKLIEDLERKVQKLKRETT